MAAEIGRSLGTDELSLGPRLGPGYSYKRPGSSDGARVMWPLEQQRELFALFAGSALPVELMESAAMRPKMSRSGLIGLHRAT
jgi:cobalamin-dependent methionine synthase I